jgi:hypothetical protein
MPAEPHTQYQLLHHWVKFNYTAAIFIQNITSDFKTITHTHTHTHTHIKPKIFKIKYASCKALNNPQKHCVVKSPTDTTSRK